MDEPTNYLDTEGRRLLYDFVKASSATLVVVSHDRKLLNYFGQVGELSSSGISIYGGNYDFFVKQKQIASNALQQDILEKEKALRKAKEIERVTLERQQRKNSRGKRKQTNSGMPRIMMNRPTIWTFKI